MDVSVGIALALGISAVGAGLGLGKAIAGAMGAMGKQPNHIPQIQTAMIIGAAFIEALVIYVFVSLLLFA